MNALQLRIPPPVVTLLFAGAMWLTAQLELGRFSLTGQRWLAGVLFGVGLAVAASGIYAFRRARTTVSPTQPGRAARLVTGGVYRVTRNPMYLGMALLLVAWAVLLGSLPSLLLVPFFVLYLNRFQIAPEERVLLQKFGRAYREYQKRVRRWLW